MFSFINHVQETISRYGMLVPEDRVLVGVSGGADSVSLLLALHELGHALAVAHLNHGLRGAESDEDERFVANLASELGIACFARRVDVGGAGGNLEAAGRKARKDFFKSLLQEHGFTKTALAHNRDDRVETFLLHLLRGAGSEGLVSMGPVAPDAVRPLIETSREQIEEYLRAQGRNWRTDRSNLDISFNRNRMRRETLPSLASLYNARLHDTLSRTVTVLQDEEAWMREMAEAWLASHAAGADAGIDAAALLSAPPALSRRVIRLALRQAGSDLHDVSFDHVEAVRGLLRPGKSGKSIPLPGGFAAMREFDRLVMVREAAPLAEFSYDLPVPGSVRVPELRRTFRAEIVDEAAEGSGRVFVDGDHLGPRVKIRNWQPGDYYRPAGWPAGKLKKLFQRARVPRRQRRNWPVFAAGSTIFWVAAFPVSREFVPGGQTQKIVAFETLPD